MHILVTGGAGFLGSHLVERLIQEGHKVTVLDNFYTGDRANIEHLLGSSQLNIMEQDIKEKFSINVDFIFNLACPASPIHYQRNPVQTLTTSVIGATNVLELASKLGIPVFQASTSEVYGDPLVTPQSEGYWGNVNPIGIRSCYDEGKRAAESLFFDYHRQYKTQIKVARIFNTYGPKMKRDDGRVVSNFIVQALENKPITIYGDGLQTRSFCFVDDLIQAFILFMNSDREIRGPINLGNPKEFTMLNLADLIISMTNSTSEIINLDLPGDDPKERKPDIAIANELLKWEPQVSLERGLTSTIEYFSKLKPSTL
jgi:UDP-glucuronate decarboxylase